MSEMTNCYSETILDCLPDPVILMDGQRLVLFANQAARELLDIQGMGIDLSMALRHPQALSAVDSVIGSDGRQTSEITLPAPVLRIFQLHATGVPKEKISDGVAAVLVLTDLTTAKRAEQMRADFVANASHELRSPLSAMLGFIETLRGAASDDQAARGRFLGIMHREARRMARLIDDLLSLSRVEINEHVRPTTPVNVGDLLLNVAESLNAQAAERDMPVRVNYGDDLPDVGGEPDELVQVFRNLIENAVRYGRENTSIDVRVERVDRIRETGVPGIAIHVTDHGEGIPKDAIPRLTERFYRVDKARSKSIGGTGLGLAIVKHIVNRHRGNLAVNSELGRGSTFSVYLPALTSDFPDASAGRTEAEIQASAARGPTRDPACWPEPEKRVTKV